MAATVRKQGASLAALRLAVREKTLSPHAVAALQHDPRAGAQALWHAVEAQNQAHRQERARLDVLLRHERALWSRGVEHVGGLDEVGVGPLLGPVVAVVVVLPKGVCIEGVDDSKKLSASRRTALAQRILEQAVGVGTGMCSALEIDAMNIYRATREAMRRALLDVPCAVDHLLVDAHRVPGIDVPQTALVMGDQLSHSIAAASIVAKVTRDAMMATYDAQFPHYGLAQHKGYGTAMHLEALQRLGPTPQHRRSFAPVRAAARAHGTQTF